MAVIGDFPKCPRCGSKMIIVKEEWTAIIGTLNDAACKSSAVVRLKCSNAKCPTRKANKIYKYNGIKLEECKIANIAFRF